MRIFLLILIIPSLFHSQSKKKISEWISELNNSQFIIDHESKASFHYSSKAADKLIRKGSRARTSLIEALNDSSKTVMVQLVLCHYWFRHASFAGPKTVTENGEHINKYYLGEEKGEGLIVSEIKKNGRFILYVKAEDRQKIVLYWKKKIDQKR